MEPSDYQDARMFEEREREIGTRSRGVITATFAALRRVINVVKTWILNKL